MSTNLISQFVVNYIWPGLLKKNGLWPHEMLDEHGQGKRCVMTFKKVD